MDNKTSNAMRPKSDFSHRLKHITLVQSSHGKYSTFVFQKNMIDYAHPVPP